MFRIFLLLTVAALAAPVSARAQAPNEGRFLGGVPTGMSFIAIFQLLGILTLAVVPLVLLMKRPPSQAGPISMH